MSAASRSVRRCSAWTRRTRRWARRDGRSLPLAGWRTRRNAGQPDFAEFPCGKKFLCRSRPCADVAAGIGELDFATTPSALCFQHEAPIFKALFGRETREQRRDREAYSLL